LKRKEKKGLEYSPTQVELRTLLVPPIQYYNELFGDYYELCEEIGLKNKHANSSEIIYSSEYAKPNCKIYINTREKMPLKFKDVETEVRTLKFGDYAFSDEAASCKCYMKSLTDLRSI
jgi:hypothetical protein